MIEPEISKRTWIKQSPSTIQFRDRIRKNCLSAVRSKRSTFVNQLRNVNPENHKDLVKLFIAEMYDSTEKIENRSEFSSFFDYIESDEYQLLMTEISEAIDSELLYDSQCGFVDQYLDEDTKYFDFSGFEDAVSSIICPLCRSSALVADESLGNAFCVCGAAISLQLCSPIVASNFSMSLAENNAEFNNRSSAVMSDFKYRLAEIHERHFQCCSQYHAKQALTGFLDEECCMETVSDTSGTKFSTIKFSELEFNVFNNHLFTYCADCSFSEQIT